MNLRERLPELGLTVVANMTSPILKAVASQFPSGGSRGRLGGRSPLLSAESPPAPATIVCSGILRGELDEVAASFADVGFTEAERRQEGDWAALLLRRR